MLMTSVRIAVLTLFLPGLLSAQQFMHPLRLAQEYPDRPHSAAAFDTLHVLAAMVQFQQDNDTRTTGDGRFVLTARTDSVIDAPPRNRAYFGDHLTFLGNYFRKASKGKLVVVSNVVDSVFSLPVQMQAYSPRPGGSDSLLANLARDTWRLVDASGRVPDFTRYDAFFVFHAGVGRDIDLVGILGYDPTPLDIPSITLGPEAFKKAYGSGYRGIPVQGGAFHITNSAILPETESRSLPSISGDVYLELGINGLCCASLGSYLGLPDLFDTKTGRSGIGRFGLMDGQAIFSFSGLFPPEPSGWEKAYLGWLNPIEITSGTRTIVLPATGFADTVYRLRFSPDEYYLLENRNRDPQQNGQRIVSVYNGVTRSQLFRRDTTGFNAFDITALAGSVVDVEDLDWSLPGGVGEQGEWYDGGLLIWHIDEGVIERGLADNTVNAEPEWRGVDLEEADGSQDIGQQYEGLFAPGSGSESGTALDFWFQGNLSPVYKNEFGASTYPDNRGNTGALSHVVVSGISKRGPVMTATALNGDEEVEVLPGFPRRTVRALATPALKKVQLDSKGPAELVVTSYEESVAGQPAAGSVFVFPTDGSLSLPGFRSDGAVASAGAPGAKPVSIPAIGDFDGDGYADLLFPNRDPGTGTRGTSRAISVKAPGPDSLGMQIFERASPVYASGSPVCSDSIVAVPAANGQVHFLRFDGSIVDSLQAASPALPAMACRLYMPGSFVVAQGSILRVVPGGPSPKRYSVPEISRDCGVLIAGPPLAGTFRAGGTERTCIVFAGIDGRVYVVGEDLQPLPGFPVTAGSGIEGGRLALADIDGDGARDIVVFGEQEVIVLNLAGAMLDNYPVKIAETGRRILSNPVVGDVDHDGMPEILGALDNGSLFALTARGTMAKGFPLAAGWRPVGLALFEAAAGTGLSLGLAAATEEGAITAWRLGGVTLTGPVGPWAQAGKDGGNSNADFLPLAQTGPAREFFPKERAYNWPNPVYDGRTNIRYYVSENANVWIKILDLAGDLVAEFSGPGVGGADNEIPWDASGVQSGVYFAHISAQGNGESGSAVVKIAVVK